MRGKRAATGLAAIAVGGVLVLGGCGGGDETSTDAKPAKSGGAMKDESGAMKHEGSMKHEEGAMKDDEGAMHDEAEKHGEAMKDG